MVGLDKTTMVVTLDELEAAGLAERRPSPTDRRARVIAVTKAGAAQGARGRGDRRRGSATTCSACCRPASARPSSDALTKLVGDRLAEPVAVRAPGAPRAAPRADSRTAQDRPVQDDLLRSDYACCNNRPPRRPRALDRPRRPLRRDAHDHPRPDDRERRPAVDPGRPRLLPVEPRLGRQRLPDRLRRRCSCSPAGSATSIGRRRIFLAGLAVFTLASLLCGVAQSQAMLIGARFVQGARRRDDVGGDPRHDRHAVPRARPSRPRRSASTASSRRPAPRSGCSPAACSPRRSTGTGSSSSTSRSASRPRISRRACSSATRASASSAGADAARRAADRRRADARRLHDRRGRPTTAGARPHTLGLGAVALALLAAFVVREATRRPPAGAAARSSARAT